MTPPDIRAFYAALGIQLPAWSTINASTHCFANPDAHRRGDHDPSCSVNLQHGAWNCHGCGAHGGAYDAAIATGQTPRFAMDLLIACGLAEPRASGRLAPSGRPKRAPQSSSLRPTPAPHIAAALGADERGIQLWAAMLHENSRLIHQLEASRGWARGVIRDLELGFDGARITIPIRSRYGALRGVLRYDPFGRPGPKMLAVPGSRLGLIPHPATEVSVRVILVEGPPDMVAARSWGLPAIAIPGTTAWQLPWAQLLGGRRVTVVMDCDAPGRRAADEVANALRVADVCAEVIDLWPGRHDGYDLTDRILERGRTRTSLPAASSIASLLRAVRPVEPNRPRARPASWR